MAPFTGLLTAMCTTTRPVFAALFLIISLLAINRADAQYVPGSFQSCGVPNSATCMLADGTGAEVCNDFNFNTRDLCVLQRVVSVNNTVSNGTDEWVCGCYHECIDAPNCNLNSPICTISEPTVFENGTCGCIDKFVGQSTDPNLLCYEPPLFPDPPACNTSESCTTDNIAQGYCHPAWNNSFDVNVVHSGCQDCRSSTVDLCLLCDHHHNGTYFCQCEFVPIPNSCDTHSDCDDLNACTHDICNYSTGTCSHQPVDCSDGNACTLNSCDETFGCVVRDLICNDGSSCTADECVPSIGCVYELINCNDDIACTIDTCNVNTGCVHTPDDGFCTDNTTVFGENQCRRFMCDPFNATGIAGSDGCVRNITTCVDHIACTQDLCNLNNMTCVYVPTNELCSDGYDCTVDECHPDNPIANNVTGCIYTPDDNLCVKDFNDPTCYNLLCAPYSGHFFNNDTGCEPFGNLSHFRCDDQIACTIDLCYSRAADVPPEHLPFYNHQTHCANVPDTTYCDDFFSCTYDVCDPTADSPFAVAFTGCVFTPVHTTCSDDLDCTVDVCVGTGTYSDSSLWVNNITGCVHDPFAIPGFCNNATLKPYDCAVGVCDPNTNVSTGCVYTPAADETCDDGIACSQDVCTEFIGCQHFQIPGTCIDPFSCTFDLCNVSAYRYLYGNAMDQFFNTPFYVNETGCFHLPFDNFCSSTPECATTTCVGNYTEASTPPNFNGNIVETQDGSGCVRLYNDNACVNPHNCTSVVCEPLEDEGCRVTTDDSLCTRQDFCHIAVCTLENGCTQVPIVCDDHNVCTDDSCNPSSGCVYTPVNDTCCNVDIDCANYTKPYGDCSQEGVCVSHQCVYANVTCTSNLYCAIPVCNVVGGCSTVPRDCNEELNPFSCVRYRCDENVDACVYDNVTSDSNCDDSTACTEDFCVENTGDCSDVLQGHCCFVPRNETCPPSQCGRAVACNSGAGCQFLEPADLSVCLHIPCKQAVSCSEMFGCDYIDIPGCCLGDSFCDDNNNCTIDTCLGVLGCQHTPVNNGALCSDGDGCTVSETCCDGVCKGVTRNCTDNVLDTVDSCLSLNATAYTCQHICDREHSECCEDCDCPRSRPRCHAVYPSLNSTTMVHKCGCVDPRNIYPEESFEDAQVNTVSCGDPTYVCLTRSSDNLISRSHVVDNGYAVFANNPFLNIDVQNNQLRYQPLGVCAPIATPMRLEPYLTSSEPGRFVINTPVEFRCDINHREETCPRGNVCVEGHISHNVVRRDRGRDIVFLHDTCVAPIAFGFGAPIDEGFDKIRCRSSLPSTYVEYRYKLPLNNNEDTFVCGILTENSCSSNADCWGKYGGHDFLVCMGGTCDVTSNVNVLASPFEQTCNQFGHLPQLSTPSGCVRDTQCCANQICRFGYCINTVPLDSVCYVDHPAGFVWNTECQSGAVCAVNTGNSYLSYCVNCTDDSQCASNQTCSGSGRCVARCSCDSDCDDRNEQTDDTCAQATGRCEYRCRSQSNANTNVNDRCCTSHKDCAAGDLVIFNTTSYEQVINPSALFTCDLVNKRCRSSCDDPSKLLSDLCSWTVYAGDPPPTPAPAPTPKPTPAPTPTAQCSTPVPQGPETLECTNDNDCSTFTNQCNTGRCINGFCWIEQHPGRLCNDSNPCTINDTCIQFIQEGGVATGCYSSIQKTCLSVLAQTSPCSSVLTCTEDPLDDTCIVADEPGSCDDGNPCTNEQCDPTQGCVYESACVGGQVCVYDVTQYTFSCQFPNGGGGGAQILNGTNTTGSAGEIINDPTGNVTSTDASAASAEVAIQPELQTSWVVGISLGLFGLFASVALAVLCVCYADEFKRKAS